MEVMVETANSSNKLRHIDQSLPIMFLVIIIFICRLYLWREQCVLATLTEDWRYCSASWCGMPSDVSSIATSFALLPLSRRAIGTMGKQKTLAKSSWIDQRLHSTNQASTSTDSLGQRTRCPSQPPIFCHRGCAPTGIASGCLRFSEDWWKVLINLDTCVSTTLPRARSYWTFWLCAGRRARPRRQPPKLSGGLGLHAGAHGAFLLACSARILRMSYRLMYTTQRKLHRRALATFLKSNLTAFSGLDYLQIMQQRRHSGTLYHQVQLESYAAMRRWHQDHKSPWLVWQDH